MKKAICVGINNYPGTSNDLQGCVNDAKDWLTALNSFGFETSLMLDSQATRQVATEPGPTPTPEPTPLPNDSPGCLQSVVKAVAGLFK